MTDHDPGKDPTPGDERLRAAAEAWDERYAASPQLFREAPDETLVEIASALPPGRALDLGAGEGRNALWLAAAGWSVTAVDASAVALERAASRARAEGVEIETVRADLRTYLETVAAERPQGAFDLVVVAFVHPGPQERAELLRAAAGVVSPGGRLFVVGHHVESHGKVGPPDRANLYAEEDVHGEDLDGLEICRLERRAGKSDVADPGVDLVLLARRALASS
ncbi:MAG TPA: class I SAM-dependent methyltransferase [Acidimicrobiales bacterium]|nr:class I SAM-dependent methyltransferase [Acidimicrobiales bacterium]